MPLDRLARLANDLVELGFEPASPAPVTTEFASVASDRFRLSQSRAAMGTVVSLTAVHASSWLIEEAFGRAYEEMDRLVDLMNRYDERSALSVLNAEARISSPPPELLHVLQRAAVVHAATDRRFDVTVAPIVDLLRSRIRDEGSHDLSAGEISDARARVGFEHVHVSAPTIHLDRPGMAVTLDGIAKGFIVDAIAAVLTAHGLRDWLIDAGGDIRASGGPSSALPWRVGVRDPAGEDILPEVLHLSGGGAVATSGGYEACFGQDRLYHHLVEPATGASAAQNLGVTVTAPDAMTADALATGVFLMETDHGLHFIDGLPGCECLIIDASGHARGSAGWTSHPPQLHADTCHERNG